MDQTSFNVVTRILSHLPTRRAVLRGLAGAGLGFNSLRLSQAVEAKKKHKKRNKRTKHTKTQPVLNQYGCLDVGQPCKGDSTRCCSGICAGKKPKKGKPDTRRLRRPRHRHV